jgi:hypothetical protein
MCGSGHSFSVSSYSGFCNWMTLIVFKEWHAKWKDVAGPVV